MHGSTTRCSTSTHHPNVFSFNSPASIAARCAEVSQSSCWIHRCMPMRQLQQQLQPQLQLVPARTSVYFCICTRRQSEGAWSPARRASCVILHSPWRRLLHPAREDWQIKFSDQTMINMKWNTKELRRLVHSMLARFLHFFCLLELSLEIAGILLFIGQKTKSK